jgi:hypothetical protein
MKSDEEGFRLCWIPGAEGEKGRSGRSPNVLGIRFIVCRIFINGWIAGAGTEQKDWEERSLILQLGFHDDGSYSLSLGRPDLCELETETIASHPPHHGPVNTHWPLLVVKKQG